MIRVATPLSAVIDAALRQAPGKGGIVCLCRGLGGFIEAHGVDDVGGRAVIALVAPTKGASR
jgi:hypothetical protein